MPSTLDNPIDSLIAAIVYPFALGHGVCVGSFLGSGSLLLKSIIPTKYSLICGGALALFGIVQRIRISFFQTKKYSGEKLLAYSNISGIGYGILLSIIIVKSFQQKIILED